MILLQAARGATNGANIKPYIPVLFCRDPGPPFSTFHLRHEIERITLGARCARPRPSDRPTDANMRKKGAGPPSCCERLTSA